MAKTYTLPKKLFGVKIPKSLRKLDWARDILESELGRRMLAEALVAAAAAAAAALVGTQTEKGAKAGHTLKNQGGKGKDVAKHIVRSATGAMATVIGNTAKAILEEGSEDQGKRRGGTAH